MSNKTGFDFEGAVRERYSSGARNAEANLCCRPSYDARYLDVIPSEIIEKDYGCGDPTQYCRPGQTVVDLGSGAGKACYVMAQLVGAEGRVIGVDMNDDMLALARKHREEIVRRLGYDNVDYRKGRIQDLRLDIEQLDAWLERNPVNTSADLDGLGRITDDLRANSPMIASDSVDLVVSNCVLNLVRPNDKTMLFEEIFRVLRRGGRAVISDIVCDEDVPEEMQRDAELWSGCISGAFREDLFLNAFEQAGFHGVEILELTDEPWQTVSGIEFRSMTVSAYKGKHGPCYEHKQAVLYKGPFSEVRDDDNHRYPRGVRIAVCRKTFELLKSGPYAEQFAFFEPKTPVTESEAEPFDCRRTAVRHARETKGQDYRVTTEASDCCGPGECC